MLRFLILSCLVECALGCVPHLTVHDLRTPQIIVGGERAYVEDYPYQLTLYRNKEYSCGASIVSSTMAITAASCTHGATARDLSVRSGSNEIFSGGTMHNVTRIHQHPDYNGGFVADISILKVNPPFRFRRNVKPIALPDGCSDVAVGTSADVTGWGIIIDPGLLKARPKKTRAPRNIVNDLRNGSSADVPGRGTNSSGASWPVNLRHVVVQVVVQSECKEDKTSLTNKSICARSPGNTTCQGEYGGPFAQNGKLFGIFSSRLSCPKGVYTRVASFRDWILRTVGHTEDLDGNESDF